MIPATPRVEHLAHAVALARNGHDREGVHQLRVASRRLDAWLRLGGWRVLRDDLAWLRSAAGSVRNLDVVLARDDLDGPFREWLAEQRRAVDPAWKQVLGAPRVDATLDALGRLPPWPRRDADVARIVARVLERGRAVDADEDDTEALHALRRSFRALRYALEWLGEDASVFVALQDAFGALNDDAVVLRWLQAFPEARPRVVAAHRRRLEDARAAVITAWRDAAPALAGRVA